MPPTLKDMRKAFGDSALSGDEKLRADNPGLKELWDQYQTMLKLIKPAKDPRVESAAELLEQIRSRLKTQHMPGVHIEADIQIQKPCAEIGMPDKPPGKIEINGKNIAIEDFNRIFGKRK